MRREGTLEEISDGRLYHKNDMVRANCLDCKGCSDCCHGMGDTIQLDPLDCHRLQEGLKLSFSQLTDSGKINLSVVDSLVLPSLSMSGEQNACVFLNEQGRCSVHAICPGICRLFPLGRYYDNGNFSYFLQVHECSLKSRTKIKVSKWVDTPDLAQYEEFVVSWHYFLKDVEGWLAENGAEHAGEMSKTILKYFYMEEYPKGEFYKTYRRKEAQFRRAFSMPAGGMGTK